MARKMLGGNAAKGGRGHAIPYANPHPNPLASAEYGAEPDLEADSKAEMSALGEAFKERRKREDQRYRHAVDASYWSAICFHSREDLQSFLDAVGVGDQLFRGRYLDGYQLARVLGVKVEFANEKEG